MAHLAEFNIARLRAPLDDPQIADFVDNLERINAMGDESPGFVWRLQNDEGTATSFDPYDDRSVIVNLTVWESIESLRSYAYQSEHRDFLRRRREWFVPMDTPAIVLWWIPEGTVPTLEESVARLDRLIAEGPTAEAFTFRTVFDPPEALVAS